MRSQVNFYRLVGSILAEYTAKQADTIIKYVDGLPQMFVRKSGGPGDRRRRKSKPGEDRYRGRRSDDPIKMS